MAKRLTKKWVVAEKSLCSGKIHNKDVVYMVSGMGKANAAHAATILLERFSPDMLIVFGVGGAYPSSGLKVGDIAVAEKEIYGDEGVLLKDGFHDTESIGIPLLKNGRKNYFNEFPLDKKLVRKALRSLAFSARRSAFSLQSGNFLTVSTCTGTRKRAIELRNRFGAICENMEGAAAAHICATFKVPLLETRGISNIVEDRDKNKWDLKLAAKNCQEAVIEVIRNY